MIRPRVLLTGAAGRVAGRMLPFLQERYDLVLLDVRATTRDGQPVAGVELVELVDSNRDAYRHHFRGIDAVVHCALAKGSGPNAGSWTSEERFRSEMDNINMAYNIYRVCAEEKVRRVVVISSNHATDYYEDLVARGRRDAIHPGLLPLSHNFYGWSKAAYELLGFVFACGQVCDEPLENVQLRIGSPSEAAIERCGPEDLHRLRRSLGAYLSPRDQAQLVIRSIEADSIADEEGVPFQVFYGISGNSHRYFSIAEARRVIGYEPEDDSQVLFAGHLAEVLRAAQPSRSTTR